MWNVLRSGARCQWRSSSASPREQHSRENTGRKGVCWVLPMPSSCWSCREKALGLFPGTPELLPCESSRLRVAVHSGLGAGGSPRVRVLVNVVLGTVSACPCQAPRCEAHTILGALVCFPNAYPGIPRLGPISEAGESSAGTADVKVKEHFLEILRDLTWFYCVVTSFLPEWLPSHKPLLLLMNLRHHSDPLLKIGVAGEESLNSSHGLSRQNQRGCRKPFTRLAPFLAFFIRLQRLMGRVILAVSFLY